MNCCGEDRTTPFCQHCGEQLIELLSRNETLLYTDWVGWSPGLQIPLSDLLEYLADAADYVARKLGVTKAAFLRWREYTQDNGEYPDPYYRCTGMTKKGKRCRRASIINATGTAPGPKEFRWGYHDRCSSHFE